MRAGDPLPQLSTKGGEKEVSYFNYHSSYGAELLDVFPTFALRRFSSGGRKKIDRRGQLREVSQIVSGRRIPLFGADLNVWLEDTLVDIVEATAVK